LLIYLEPVLQQKLVPVLHYALKPVGFLWLGGSETGASRDECGCLKSPFAAFRSIEMRFDPRLLPGN
jgi:two-component system CheB/CheR fusion protein